MNDNTALADRLAPDAAAHLARIARERVAEEDRDAFFKHACDMLRPIREICATDVRRAAAFALGKIGR